MVHVQLPAEVWHLAWRSDHVDVIPPAWRSPSDTLAVLHVAKQIRELQACIGARVVSPNQDGVRVIFLVLDVAEHFRCTREEIALQFRANGHTKVRMLEGQSSPVVERETELRSQRLVNEHFPNTGKNLAPTTLAVAYVAFLVKVITPSMRHQVMVASIEEAFLEASKVVSKPLRFRPTGHVRRNGFTPFGDGFLKREAPISVKHRVEACCPAF